MDASFSKRVAAWGAKPFAEDMDWIQWMLFVGFISVLMILWTRVLKTLEI